MKIELKKVQVVVVMSEETTCFSAMVMIDDVTAGVVGNDGRGGSHRYSSRSLEDRLTTYAKTLPDVVCGDNLSHDDPTIPFTYPQDADTVIDTALHDHLARKRLRALIKNKLMFATPDGKLYSFGQKRTPAELAAIVQGGEAEVLKAHGDKYAHCLNCMAEDAALAAYGKSL